MCTMRKFQYNAKQKNTVSVKKIGPGRLQIKQDLGKTLDDPEAEVARAVAKDCLIVRDTFSGVGLTSSPSLGLLPWRFVPALLKVLFAFGLGFPSWMLKGQFEPVFCCG